MPQGCKLVTKTWAQELRISWIQLCRIFNLCSWEPELWFPYL
jgi:hypothetical protein